MTHLDGDGDFRNKECINILKQADVVVTNPPFSLFREYLSQLVEYEKAFIVLGSVNAITYKEVFPLFMADRLWLGPSISSGDREFGVPDDYPLEAATCRVDGDGKKFIRVKGVRWFTNIDHKKRHEELILYRSYKPEEYPKYSNYDAIEVSKVKDIPKDYAGAIGVPITFLDKHNPDQFEILGSSRVLGKPMSDIAKRGTYRQGGPRFYLRSDDGTYRRLFDRLVVRNKMPKEPA